MTAVAATVLGFALLATSALDSPPPTEQQIEAQLKALRKQAEDLRAKEEALRKQLVEAKARPVGGIKAEVRGVLKWADKGGHYILTRSAEGDETRVYLRYSEDKVTGRKLEGLMGKEVVATGPLAQLPTDVKTFIPPGAVYLTGSTVEEVPHKDTEQK